METRTLLRDFQSHNQTRSVFRVDAGSVIKASKVRLVDFNVYTDLSFTTKWVDSEGKSAIRRSGYCECIFENYHHC